jgi:hypothetical protein
MQPRRLVILGAESVALLEGHRGLSAAGRGETAPGGVFDHGTQQRGRSRHLGGPRSSSAREQSAEPIAERALGVTQVGRSTVLG